MNQNPNKEAERQTETDSNNGAVLREAESAGGWRRVATYLKLSGPGFLQSALTLGGGSLAGSLYLGALAGPSMLWVQPLAMLIGIIMLSAIAYVTLSTGEPPFHAVKTHVNPVLGWAWAIAAFVANMVWVMPQYTLGVGVFQQNLLPNIFGAEGVLSPFASNFILVLLLFATALAFTWSYGRGGWGVRLFERSIKLMVGLIMVSFIGVVIRLSVAGELDWSAILAGLIPRPGMILRPAEGFMDIITQIPRAGQAYWESIIVDDQRGVMITTAATAVGVNMTFLFGYSLLKRGWDRSYRTFAKFDLGFGLLIPFLIATACVVIAASSQFHLSPQGGLMPYEELITIQSQTDHTVKVPPANITASAGQQREYRELLVGRALAALDSPVRTALQSELDQLRTTDATAYERHVATLLEETTPHDRYLAAMLVRRNNFDLARALEPFTGFLFAQYVFGIGVLGMAFSSITMMMIISGICFCEFCKKPHEGWWFRLGALFPVTGVFAPFWWHAAGPWLVVPTSMFAFLLIPLAYISFFLLMNQSSMLGNDMPRGRRRIAWNIFMGLALLIIVPSSLYVLFGRYGLRGLAVAGALLAAIGVAHVLRPRQNQLNGGQQ